MRTSLRRLIVVRISGGLGNQLFQYACARSLAKENKAGIVLDISGYQDYRLHKYCLDKYRISICGCIRSRLVSAILRKLLVWMEATISRNSIFKDLVVTIDDERDSRLFGCFSRTRIISLDGYFQSSVFFESAREVLIKELGKPKTLEQETRKIAKDISESNAVSVHIRRGDYLSDSNANAIHGVCTYGYYRRAYRIIKERDPSISVFIFSDDIEWCKDNVQDVLSDHAGCIRFIEHTDSNTNHDDLYLMSLCKHNILANSTFSWWGAWLGNKVSRIVVAPNEWFAAAEKKDEHPGLKEWLRV